MNKIYSALILCGAAILASGNGANAFTCFQSTSGNYGCGPCDAFMSCDGASTSFETKHSWKVATPGTLKLSGTKFAIALVEATLTYSLRYRDKELSVHQTLRAAEEQGVARARELQEMGMPLD